MAATAEGIPEAVWAFAPLLARTRSNHRPSDPAAHDCVQVIVVRDGSAIVFSEFGEQPVTVGDVILLGANTLCGSEPEGHLTSTTIYADTDYLIDQVFWQHCGALRDRQDARELAETIYTEPSQILGIGEDRAGLLMPWLDELTMLSQERKPVANFYRMQALWFSIAHVLAPFIRTSEVRVSATQRATTWPSSPRIRRFSPLRMEARKLADLLRSDPERHWSVDDLARHVHLSKSQVGRLFVEAFGKSPIAYLTMLRTERMAVLLRTTDASITEIAGVVGWSDPDFAARQFRRNVGIAPSGYRALVRAQASSEARRSAHSSW